MATIKQKRAFKKTLENGGNVSKAMRESQYAASMAKNPQKLTLTKGWKELSEEYLNDQNLAERHQKLLKDKNHSIQLGALGLAYRVKGYLEEPGKPTQNVFNFFNLNVKELTARKLRLMGRVGQTGVDPAGARRSLPVGKTK